MEQINEITAQILRSGTFVLALAIVVATFFTRKIVELTIPHWKKAKDANEEGVTYKTNWSRWWNEVILYAVPVLFGMAIASFHSEFMNGGANENLGTRLAWGGGVGWFSSFFYKIMKKLVLKKTGVSIDPGPVKPEG